MTAVMQVSMRTCAGPGAAAQILPFAELMTRRPFIVVDYDRLIAAPAGEMRRIAQGLRLPLSTETESAVGRYAQEFVSVGFRHDQATEQLADSINPLTWDLYRRLLDLACDASAPGDPDVALDLAQLARRFKAMAPTLALVDELEGELRRRGPTVRAMALAAWKHLPTAATLADLRALLKSRGAAATSTRQHAAGR